MSERRAVTKAVATRYARSDRAGKKVILDEKVSNAVGHRSAMYSVGALSLLHDGDTSGVRQAHEELLAPFASHVLGHSLNFAFGPLEPAQVRSAFAPADADRLGRIKARYDPQGLLHANHPILSPAPPNDSDSGRT